MSSTPSSTDLPALPDNLHNLKRPALLALCRIWNVKASGKNAELIYRLQSAAANRGDDDSQDDDDDEDDSGEGSSQDSQSDSDEEQVETDHTPETTVSIPRSPAFSAFQNLPAHSEQGSPSRKRTRETSPQVEHEAKRRGPLGGALKSRSTMAAHFTDAPAMSPATQRKMKPLPRKSVLPGIKMAIQQTQDSPTRDDLAGGTTTWTSSSNNASPGGLYPALPTGNHSPALPSPTRTTTVPQFTFTCSPTAPSPLPSPTRSPLPSSATTSVLAQLNARLAASGHAPAALHKSPSTQTLHHSASASSLLRAKAQEGGLSHSPSARFDAAHEQSWNRQGGIDSHWSMKRFKSQTNLKDTEAMTIAAEASTSRATKKVKREETGSVVKEKAPTAKPAPSTAKPTAVAPAPAPASTTISRHKAGIKTGTRPSLLSSRKSKSRSSLSAGRIGRKSLIGSAGASGLPKKSSSLKPSKPFASSSTKIAPRADSNQSKPSSSIPTATSSSPVRRFFAFGSTTMKKGAGPCDPTSKLSSAVKQSHLPPPAAPPRPLSPSKQANVQASSNPANSQAANALRVAQARKKAAEESRRKMHLMKQHHKTATSATSKGVSPA